MEDKNERDEDSEENSKRKEKESLQDKIRENPWTVATVVLGLIVIVLLVLVMTGTGFTGNVVKEDVAVQNLLKFAEDNGIEAELVSTYDTGSLYEITLLIRGEEQKLYVTKDGDLIVQPVVDLTLDSQEIPTQSTPTEIPKSDKPEVELFVMSFCPYGNRAEDTMKPVYDLLKNNINFNVHYIVSVSGSTIQSLHGQPEVDEDEREACVLKNEGLDKWWEFVTYVNKNCGSDGSCWKDAAKESGILESSISSCVSNDGLTLMKENGAASDSAGANGSPTLIVNGVQSSSVYQYENPEAYKQAICSAFNEAPEECNQKLSGSTQTSTGGSC